MQPRVQPTNSLAALEFRASNVTMSYGGAGKILSAFCRIMP
jgi:hypothetical protein